MTILEKDKNRKYDILWFPEENGYIECDACGGYGSTNRQVETEFFMEICGTCGGDGVLPVNTEPAGSGDEGCIANPNCKVTVTKFDM